VNQKVNFELAVIRPQNKNHHCRGELQNNRSSMSTHCEALVKALVISFAIRFASALAASLWVLFVGPWIARFCGIPVRADFWTMNRQDHRLTRFQFVWAFGVLVYGVGMFLFTLAPDVIHRLSMENRWSARLADLGFSLAITVFMGILIGLWCAPTQIGESPVTRLDLSRRQ
jgi:hypothetical protein